MTDLRNPQDVIDLLQRAAATLRGGAARRGSVDRIPDRGRLLATGDLHDNPVHLERVLALARLDRSPDHHVLLHEMIHGERLVNGLDFSHRMLCRVADLVLAHPGQVHPVLANHELSQMTGVGVSKGAGNSVELFDGGLEYVFGGDWEDVAAAIGGFVAAMPLALISESGLLCAHSLPSARAMHRFDPAILDRELTADDYEGPHGSAYLMVWGRGYTAESVEQLAGTWGVKLFCVGHQHAENGIDLRAERVIVLNSDHERAMALPLDLANLPEPTEALLSGVPLSSVASAP